jgi:hypothetical protein
MFVNNHTCALVLLFGTNCPYECRKPVKCLLSDVWYFTFFQSIFSWGEITCVWVLNLCLNYRFLQQLTRSRTVYCITRCEDNWRYWDTCQYYIIYWYNTGFDINFLTNLSIRASAILILLARNCKLLPRILKCHICM